MSLTEAQQTHLGFIQGIISRQAGNSFLIKGWVLTVTAAVAGFAISQRNWKIAALGLGPLFIFAWLDAYYFRQERLFRCLYNAVVRSDGRIDPFSMDTRIFKSEDNISWWSIVRSPPFAVLYTALLLSELLIIIILAYTEKRVPHIPSPHRTPHFSR
jgi:hypothetical protein